MDHENGTREEAGEVRPQRKNKYYKTRGARAAAVRVYEHKSVLSPKKSSCISLKEKKKSFHWTAQASSLSFPSRRNEAAIYFPIESRELLPAKKKKKKKRKRKKKATMSPASPSAWFMEMHLPIFFPPIIGKYSNKSENVRQFCYHLVGYPNTLSSEKPRDVTVTRQNITRVKGWPKKSVVQSKSQLLIFQHRMEDHHTEMCSPLSWLYLDHSIFQIDFCGNNARCLQTGLTTHRRKCNVCKETAAGQWGPVQCIHRIRTGF